MGSLGSRSSRGTVSTQLRASHTRRGGDADGGRAGRRGLKAAAAAEVALAPSSAPGEGAGRRRACRGSPCGETGGGSAGGARPGRAGPGPPGRRGSQTRRPRVAPPPWPRSAAADFVRGRRRLPGPAASPQGRPAALPPPSCHLPRHAGRVTRVAAVRPGGFLPGRSRWGAGPSPGPLLPWYGGRAPAGGEQPRQLLSARSRSLSQARLRSL